MARKEARSIPHEDHRLSIFRPYSQSRLQKAGSQGPRLHSEGLLHFWDPPLRRVVISHDAIFDEHLDPVPSTAQGIQGSPTASSEAIVEEEAITQQAVTIQSETEPVGN